MSIFDKNLKSIMLIIMQIFFFCLIAHILFGETARFEIVSLEQGLSQSSVNAILQDSKGFMWFATQDGLNKYDGYNFTVFKLDPRNENSLSHNFINIMIKDSKGIFWIGTNGGGLDSFDPVTEKWVRYMNNPNDPDSLSYNYVQSIYEDREGAIWVGTNGGGLNKLDPEQKKWTRYQNEPGNSNSLSNNTVTTIYEDKDSTIWVGTAGGGLNRFDQKNGKWTAFQNNPDDPMSVSNNFISTFYKDERGVFWIGTTGGGFNKFDPVSGQWMVYQNDPTCPCSLSSNNIFAFYRDKEGIFWIGTTGGGLNKFNAATKMWTRYQHNASDPNSLSNDNIVSIFEDNAGVVWIGTNGGGVNKLERRKEKWVHYNYKSGDLNSLDNNDVRAIYEDDNGILWIGTNGGGVDKFERTNGKWTHLRNIQRNSNSLSNDAVRSIMEDSKGILWIGTWGSGIDRYDRKQEKWTNYRFIPRNENSLSNNFIRFVYEDIDGLFWIGTWGGGLDKFNEKTQKWIHYRTNPNNTNSISTNFIFSILEDEGGILWIGTWGGGLMKFDKVHEKWTRYIANAADRNALNNSSIASLYKDSNGVLWIGTWGGGLNRFEISSNKWIRYTTENGLPNDVIYGILPDDHNNLWLSTNAGLVKFNPSTGRIKNYDVNDGIQGNEFNSGAYFGKKSSQELFFGGLNGLNAFYPDTIQDNLHVPPVVITSFKKFDKEIKPGRPLSEIRDIKLSYKENVFSFSFVALDYANPLKNQYAYKMEGFDKEWIYSGNRRFASYMNLDGGTYIFRVKGSNNNGIWNEEGASIKIKIDPPPWKTWWAYCLYVVMGITTVSGYARIKTREHAKQLEAKVKELERERLVAMQEKKLLAIHHELETARKIQSFILPHQMPSVKDIMIAVQYVPVEAVAGDFYDFLEVDDTHLGILVADASGHGVPAALISSMVKVAISAQVLQASDPAKVLIAMNNIFYGKLQEQFVTAAYLYLDTKNKLLRYCGAGHPPLLIWRKTEQKFHEMLQNGLILGPFPSADYSNAELNLQTDDRIFICTDGILEAMNSHEETFGFDHFKEFIKDNSHLDADRFGKSFLQHLMHWSGKSSGASFDDDVTLIIVDVL